jgi:hypothetical protein
MKNINKMNQVIFLLLIFAVIGIYSFAFSAPAEKAQCGGAVEIHAGAYKTGCLTGPGGTVNFTTNGRGTAYITDLCPGNYSVCVQDWGAATFMLPCHCEIGVTVPNNVDCSC